MSDDKLPMGEGDELRIAHSEWVEVYAKEVDEIIEMLGIEWAFVTDLSRIGDFPELEAEELERFERAGLHPKDDDYIWQLAKRLREVRNG